MPLVKIIFLLLLLFIGQDAKSYSYSIPLSDTMILDSVMSELNVIEINSNCLKKAIDKVLGKTKKCLFSQKGLPPIVVIYPRFGIHSLQLKIQIETDLVFIDTNDLLYPNIIGASKYKGVNILLYENTRLECQRTSKKNGSFSY